MITCRPRSIALTRTPFLGCLAVCLAVLSATVPAFGADQPDVKRHSLILRPAAGHVRAMASGLPFMGQANLPSPASPSASPTASPPHKLAKYPTVEKSPVQATQSLQTQLSQGAGSAGKPASAVLLSNAAKAMPMAATAPIKAGQQPVTGALPVQPIAASGTGPASQHGGSRAAMNLFNIRGLTNLIHAPPPPVVAPSSHAPVPSKSTPQTTPSPSSSGSTPNTRSGNSSSNQSSNAPAPVQKTGTAILSWNMGTENDLAGYKVYVGTRSGSYSYPGSPFTIGRTTSYKVDNLPQGQTYYFALSAYDTAGNTSPLSAEVHKSIY